ncbi:hypothetical protein ACQ5SO_00505 [Rhodovulum sp. DZ06]|uniref:hypothetical protein n=1 Tax=Rhodovulum sp. DZ06 TaxID=3425126 RepID=UPI003D331DBB
MSPEDPDIARFRDIGLAAGEPWFIQSAWVPAGLPDAEADDWVAARIIEKAGRGDPGARYLRAVRADLHRRTGTPDFAPYRMPRDALRAELLALARMGHHAPMHRIGQGVLLDAGDWAGIATRREAARFFGRAALLGNYCALRALRDSPVRAEVLAALTAEEAGDIADWWARLKDGPDQDADFLTSW